MHEILTLQLGHRANYVAAHFWNTQESYFTYDAHEAPSPVDHDIHFRAGLGLRGEETFTPRTLIYDLKGGFGTLKKGTGLYDEDVEVDGLQGAENGVWSGNVVVQKEAAIPLSEYQQDLERATIPQKPSTATVRYWSDFNRVFYHPRSIVQINDYELGSSLMPFEKWECGEELFAGMDRNVDLLDRDVRVWAEECDHMQGFQVLNGGDDAWGGFGARYLEKIRDEFGKTAIWVWGIEEEHGTGQRAKQTLRTVNAAKSMYEMSTHASIYVPLSIPSQLPQYVNINRRSEWHTSALLSMSLETMTLPSRNRDLGQRGDLEMMSAALNINGQQRLASLQCSVIQSSEAKGSEAKTEEYMAHQDDRMAGSISSGWEFPNHGSGKAHALDMEFSNCNSSGQPAGLGRDHVFGQVESLRGCSEVHGDGDEDDGMTERKHRVALPMEARYQIPLRFPLLDSFPGIVSPPSNSSRNSLVVRTRLSTTSEMSTRTRYLQQVVNRMTALDEREALSNGLGEIAEAYTEGWDSGSDDDSDD